MASRRFSSLFAAVDGLPSRLKQISKVGAKAGARVAHAAGDFLERQEHLPLAEVAARLDIAPSTLRRWARQGRIPVQCDGDGCQFDQRELDAWLASHSMSLSSEAEMERERESHHDRQTLHDTETLEVCVRRGGVHHLPAYDDVAKMLEACVDCMPVSDRPALLERLLERERLASTGLGQGVAVPHPRKPLGEFPTASVYAFFPERPVDFGAIDGKPVFVIFILLSPNVQQHLQLLSRLAFFLRDESFLSFLEARPAPNVFFERLDALQPELAAALDDGPVSS